MIYRYATVSVLGFVLTIIWMGHAPYLHDFGEWVFQSKILTLHWSDPEQVTGFQWATYPVPNSLAILIMAIFGLAIPAITAAKLFLTILLAGWFFVLRKFVRQLCSSTDYDALVFILFSLVALSNFFWTGFVSYQLGLLLLTLFLTRFGPSMRAAELATLAVLIFLSHAMVFLVFVLLVLLDTVHSNKRLPRILALFPAGVLSLWFVIGRSLAEFSTPIAGAAMADWSEVIIYKLGYPLMLGPFKSLLQPDLSSLLDHLPWFYWSGFIANVLVVSGVGIFILLAIWSQQKTATRMITRAGFSRSSLRISASVLLLFYVIAPYNFFGLINPSGRVTIPLLLISLLLLSSSTQVAVSTRLLRALAPIVLVFTFFTVFSYMMLMHRAETPEYLSNVAKQKNMPTGVSVLEYNTRVYSQARYNYFNYRIFGFSARFTDIELEHYNRLGFRTALLVGFKEP